MSDFRRVVDFNTRCVSWTWVVLVLLILVSSFLSFDPSSRSHPVVACSGPPLSVVGSPCVALFPGVWLCALTQVGLLGGAVPVGSSVY